MQTPAALLQWYIDAGVDEAIQDEPRNYFAASPAAPAMPEIPIPAQNTKPAITLAMPLPAPQAALHHAPSAAMAEARKLADEATTLEALESAVRGFEGCALKKTATKTVFADGNKAAKLMLIGEAPGAQEDAQGIPFCGPSGALLDKMFGAIGYDRTKFYITNTLFWRPPGNRTPSPEEIAICKPFVERHVALIDPALIVLVGGTAIKSVLGMEGITKMRGKSYTYQTPYSEKEYPVSVIYHPSYLLRAPVHKRVTWQDLLKIKEFMGGTLPPDSLRESSPAGSS